MSDYRFPEFDYRNPEDSDPYDAKMDPDAHSPHVGWGWIAAAIFLAVILAVALGLGQRLGGKGTNTVSNEMGPPAVAHTVQPAIAAPPATTAPGSAIPAPPLAPVPNAAPQQPSGNSR